MMIKTLSPSRESRVSYCPERGGIITSLMLQGTELLYLDRETLLDPTKNVRGGIPLLFPNAGAIESEQYPGLKQHGFARLCSHWISEQDSDTGYFSETLSANKDTKRVYPYDFTYVVRGQFEQNGSFTLTQEVTNKELTQPLPLSMGLHPYFKVPHDQKQNICFNFPGGQTIETGIGTWSQGGTTFSPNPRVQHPDCETQIYIPSLGTLVLNASPEYQRVWIWSLPEKDFICIEPAMRDVGGLVNDPEFIAPGETLHATLNIRLEKTPKTKGVMRTETP